MLYNKTIIDHFTHPRNQGKIKNADGVGEAGNPICGDIMKIYLKVKKQGSKEIISNIKFQTLGCATAIANSSVLTEIVKGRDVKDALKVTNKDLIKKLGGDVPRAKIHCSFLAKEALEAAVKDYQSKK
ncbi:MAG: iron-sulfur cluster assembly scaffold protein [Patescibacteria group bacterium]|jgi:nitrogen fixation NifU-like protein